jgi:hypothetical protein
LAWLNLDKVSPMTWRPRTTSMHGVEPARGPVPLGSNGGGRERRPRFAWSESWAALSMAVGQSAFRPTSIGITLQHFAP